ncbi:MAG TPA: helix-turn-helix domain-containing protein [Mycobacteriales bacterium]|nr:helix-turn-helix domain-containing protein [Mycobacteriales bacterium]
MPTPGAKVVRDLTELRALAHPIRHRLLDELAGRGEASVGQLAEAVHEPVNRASFHLRQLAKYGFIEEAPERARDGRDRWWRLAFEGGIDWDHLARTAAGAAAVRQHLEATLRRHLDEIESYFASAVGEYPKWENGAFSHDWYLDLTEDEAAEFDREYLELCLRWRDRIRIRDRDAAEPTKYGIFIFGFPMRDS